MMVELLETSTDPTLQKLSKKTRNSLAMCDAIKSTLYSKYVVIEEQNPLTYQLINECKKYFNSFELSRLKITADDLFPTGHAWPFRKNSPYLETFNLHLLSLFESGLFDVWLKKYMKSDGSILLTSGRGFTANDDKTFSLKKFIGPVAIWGIGIIASIVCFICEVLCGKYKKRQKNKLNINLYLM